MEHVIAGMEVGSNSGRAMFHWMCKIRFIVLLSLCDEHMFGSRYGSFLFASRAANHPRRSNERIDV